MNNTNGPALPPNWEQLNSVQSVQPGYVKPVSTSSSSTHSPKSGPDQNQNIKERRAFVFPDVPNKMLFCPQCQHVFTDPVITSCGHTFCRQCTIDDLGEPRSCPVDMAKLQVIVSNLSMGDQIKELFVHCRNGCKLSESGLEYVVDPSGCPATFRISEKEKHELVCDYALVPCPNNSSCPHMMRRDVQEHVKTCIKLVNCTYGQYGCNFHGTQDELSGHLNICAFEKIKEFIHQTDDKMKELHDIVNHKDQEIAVLRSMLANLFDRVDSMQSMHGETARLLEGRQNKMDDDLSELRQHHEVICDEVTGIQEKLALGYGGCRVDPQQTVKCAGTFVGHAGPIWCLTSHVDFLFSGSQDKTIKVWGTGVAYCCVQTLEEHRGNVLSLLVHGGLLFSGSEDCTIVVWKVDGLEKLRTMQAHDSHVCALAANKNTLFSGSHQSVKAWDLGTFNRQTEITSVNHWVRALATCQTFLYTGSFGSVKAWDMQNYTCIYDFDTPESCVYSLVVTERFVICGTKENLIHIWEKNSQKQLRPLSGHTGAVYALTVLETPSGSRLFSASDDGTMRIWNVESMICSQTVSRHDGSVTCLTISKGRVFSGASDGTIKVWHY